MSDILRLTCAEVDELAGLYVLDALESGEMEAVREHLASCSNPHAAFSEVGGVVPALFETSSRSTRPPELRARVLACRGRGAGCPRPAGDHAGAAACRPRDERPVPAGSATQVRRRQDAPFVSGTTPARRIARSPWQTVLAAAAVLLIVVLGGWNLLLQDRAGTAETRVAILRDAIAASTDPTSQVALLRGSRIGGRSQRAGGLSQRTAGNHRGGGPAAGRHRPDVPGVVSGQRHS